MVYSKAKCKGKRNASLETEMVWWIEWNNTVIGEFVKWTWRMTNRVGWLNKRNPGNEVGSGSVRKKNGKNTKYKHQKLYSPHYKMSLPFLNTSLIKIHRYICRHHKAIYIYWWPLRTFGHLQRYIFIYTLNAPTTKRTQKVTNWLKYQLCFLPPIF